MSGGHFDYIQDKIGYAAENLERIISKNNVEIPRKELSKYAFNDDGTVKEEEKYYYHYSEDAIKLFKEAYWKLREAKTYIERVDYFICDDDGEEEFKEHLNDELSRLNRVKKRKKWTYRKEED